MGALQGKVVVVTGASRGLGEAMAIGYAKEGAAVVLAARTTEDLDRVAKLCKDAGAAAISIVPTDVTDESQIAALVSKTVAEHGKLDVFVANAGISYMNLTGKRFRELVSFDRDIVEQILDVNVIGTWMCMKAAIPAMTKGGSFIAIGSETGRALYPGSGFYALTKSMIDAMATLASKESAEAGIRVNVLSPGAMVDTHLFGPNKMPDFLKQQHPPLPADAIVPAAVWLATDESEGITGKLMSAKEFNTGARP